MLQSGLVLGHIQRHHQRECGTSCDACRVTEASAILVCTTSRNTSIIAMASVADIPGLAEWSPLAVALAPGEDAQPQGGGAQQQVPPEGLPAKFSGLTAASPINPHWGLHVSSKGKIQSLKRVLPDGTSGHTLRSTRADANNKRRKLAQAIVNKPFRHHKFSQKTYAKGADGRQRLSGERRLRANGISKAVAHVPPSRCPCLCAHPPRAHRRGSSACACACHQRVPQQLRRGRRLSGV